MSLASCATKSFTALAFNVTRLRHRRTLQIAGSKLELLCLRGQNNFVQLSWLNTSSSFLAERRYSPKHEWVSKDGNIGTIGISNYAQEALGDVVYVQLPDVGATFSKNEEIGAVESVKAASEIYTPVAGKVVEVNQQLEDKPGLVNTSCTNEGWIVKLELADSKEFQELMDENAYSEYLKTVKN